MGIYFDIIRFSFLKFFAYPWEIIASVLKRIVEILFLILFWSLIVESSGGSINTHQIISYFFISMGIRDLVMSHWGAFGGDLGNQIKTGDINKYLMKPIKIIPTLYSLSLGRNGMRTILAGINLLIGIAIFPPKNITSVLLFIIFFICAWWISFAYNLLQGILFFHLTDAGGVRNAINNIVRVFSGEMVPIYLFPPAFGKLINLTPFPSMVYGPSIALNIDSIDKDVLVSIFIAIFWSIALNITSIYLWRMSIKKYEAIGI